MKDYTKDKSLEMLEPFFPNELFRHVIVSCFLVIVEFIAIIIFPLPFKLINKPDYIPWFLLPLYKLSKLIHGEVVFISLVVVCALLFISWPFHASKYDTKHRKLWQRPIPFAIVIITLISLITLCFLNL